MKDGLNPLISMIEKSGRLSDPGIARPVLDVLKEQLPSKGYNKNFLRQLVQASLQTSDPLAALNRMARLLSLVDDRNFYSLLEDPAGLSSLMVILGYSNFLSSLIMRSPADYVWIMRDIGLGGDRDVSAMQEYLSDSLAGVEDDEEIKRVLRVNKYREMLRIGIRDLLNAAEFEETVSDISSLAEISIGCTVTAAQSQLHKKHGVALLTTDEGMTRPCKFCVLGMGKLGGDELNYSSDIDLYYLYTSHEGMSTGRRSASRGYRDSIENHVYYVRLGELVTSYLNDRTADGIVFRVDLRLRPEGESGELAYSLPSLEVYYQSWGRTIDRLPLLKARALGGDRRLGEEFLDMMTPFIYKRHLDYTALEEMGILKNKIDKQVNEAGRGIRDVKLGRGGIREIEFIVQSQQLIHGGRNPSIRERNTLRALERLMQNGYLAERDADLLREAYVFLRNVEHRIQLVEERQTQELPSKSEDIESLAWSMGFTGQEGAGVRTFEGLLNKHTDAVSEQFDRLFFVEKTSRSIPELPESGVLSETRTEKEAVEYLRADGFRNPEEAYRNLLLLRDGPPYAHFSDTCRNLLRQIAPRLMVELKAVSDPDSALANLSRFITRVGARASYYSMLADNPHAIHLLAVLFGSSPFLSGLLLKQPDLLDIIVTGTDLSEEKPPDIMDAEVKALLDNSPSFEDELVALRRYRNSEILRIGIGDLLGKRESHSVSNELTSLAEVMLACSHRLAHRDIADKSGAHSGYFGVVAMGKLGGREMNYSSDMDIIFLYEGEEGSREFFTRVAQRMITILTSPTAEGSLYEIDMRLRPSGHSGPLVITIEAFERYHKEGSMVWERQAMTKARWVAGDEKFRERVVSLIDEIVFGGPISGDFLDEIARVRKRMEDEIADETGGKHYDIKTGYGGLVDIEFAVQMMQLAYGRKIKSLRTQSTIVALDAAAETGLADEKQYNTLRRSYSFYREIENRSQIYQDRSDSKIPLDEDKLTLLAMRMGYKEREKAAGDLLDDIRANREQVRELYDIILRSLRNEMDQDGRDKEDQPGG